MQDTDTSLEKNEENPPSEKKEFFHLRSEAAQEIISHKPGFIEKWALILFTIILILLITGTWFIRYPDLVEADGRLTAENEPKEIIPLRSGRLVRLMVQNGAGVSKGDIIGWMESSADAGEVLHLSQVLDNAVSLIASGNDAEVPGLFSERYNQLGELQTAFQAFTTALQQYNDYFVNGFYRNKKGLLNKDMATLRQMQVSMEAQKGLMKQDEDSSRRTLEMNKILFEEKVISAEEFREAKSKHLNKQMALPQLRASILNNESQQRDKLKELEQLDHDADQQMITFKQALLVLKSNVDQWIQQYVLEAHSSGRVVFAVPMEANKFVEQGKVLGYINPRENSYYVELNLPQNNLGKVDTGMRVQLRFDAYPYQETGFVRGQLDYMSPIASDTGFLATVRLTRGLTTNLHNRIAYKNGLKVHALIITRDMRLLQRMYYSVVKSASPGN